MAAAQTGTGKTAGFTLPLLELLSKGEHAQGNQVRALVLTPTRELAAQVAESVKDYDVISPLKIHCGFWWRKDQSTDDGTECPARHFDRHARPYDGSIQPKRGEIRQVAEILVLDEADRMLDMGFIQC